MHGLQNIKVTSHDCFDGICLKGYCCCFFFIYLFIFLNLNRRSQQAAGGLQVQTSESRTRCVNIAGQCKCSLEEDALIMCLL